MTIDNSIAIGVVTIASTVMIWAVRSVSGLEGRMNLYDERHNNLARTVEDIKHNVHSGIEEIRRDSREFRVEMLNYNKELRVSVGADLQYIKERVDKINLAAGNPRLRRDNDDDRAANERV